MDKTLLIKDLLDDSGDVNLFTRPRCFGKMLALSMLRYYFERTHDYNGNPVDRRSLFPGVKIMEAGEEYVREMGKYPVINLSLKSAKQPTYEMAYASLIDEIAEEYRRHSFILGEDCLSEGEKNKYCRIMGQPPAGGECKGIGIFIRLPVQSIWGEDNHFA